MANKPNNSGVKKAPAAVAAKSPAASKESSPPDSPAVKATVAKSAAAKPAVAKSVAAKPAVAKPAAPAAAKPVAKAAKPAAPQAAASEAPGKAKKEGKKPKLVPDSFTLPESDYALFASMKARCLAKGVEVKKSELLRAALRQLSGLDDPMLIAVMAQVERIKTGRPAG